MYQGFARAREHHRRQYRRRRHVRATHRSLPTAHPRRHQGGAQVCGRGREQRRFYPSPSRRPVSARLKVDEDLPRQIADLCGARGHDVTTVAGQGWQGIADEILWTRIQGERRWLISAATGFADLRNYPPGSHAGVILLRPQEESRRAYLDLAESAVSRLDLDQMSGAM